MIQSTRAQATEVRKPSLWKGQRTASLKVCAVKGFFSARRTRMSVAAPPHSLQTAMRP